MYFLLNRAMTDFEDIGIYTKETWGVAQCEIYLDMLESTFSEIASSPRIGTRAEWIDESAYKYPAGKHVILYRILANYDIEIVRILNQSMDIKAH